MSGFLFHTVGMANERVHLHWYGLGLSDELPQTLVPATANNCCKYLADEKLRTITESTNNCCKYATSKYVTSKEPTAQPLWLFEIPHPSQGVMIIT